MAKAKSMDISSERDGQSSKLKDAISSWIEAEIKRRGLSVKRNVTVEGRGIEYQFDLIGEINILPGASVNIGFIIFDKDIGIDDVAKIIGLKEALPIEKIVVVAVGSISSEAYELALSHGISVVVLQKDTTKMIEYQLQQYLLSGMYRYIEPIVAVEEIVKKLYDRVRHSIFRKPRCRIEKLVLVYVPLIEYRIEIPHRDTSSGEVEVLEGKAVFDGVRGYAVYKRNNGMSIDVEQGPYLDIPIEALDILRMLSEDYSAELESLAGRLGASDEQIRPILNLLSSLGLIEVYGELIEFRGLDLDRFFDIDRLVESLNLRIYPGEPPTSSKVFRLGLRVDMARLEEVLAGLRAKVLGTWITYYPLYVAIATETKNGNVHEKPVVYDAITGEENENFSMLLADPDIIDRIEELKGFEDLGEMLKKLNN